MAIPDPSPPLAASVTPPPAFGSTTGGFGAFGGFGFFSPPPVAPPPPPPTRMNPNSKEGIVLLAPESTQPGQDQRGVLVAAADDTQFLKVFNFKSSWLDRAHNDGTRHYKLGDRVQLDVAKYNDENTTAIEVEGKCLGTVASGVYGRVVGLGVSHGAGTVQRNIEVVSVGGSHDGKVSLYPSYALVPACRRTVLTENDRLLLESKVTELLSQNPAASSIDIPSMINRFGLQIWPRIIEIISRTSTVTRESIFMSWEEWEDSRDQDWPTNEPSIEEIEAIYIDPDTDPDRYREVHESENKKFLELSFRLPLPAGKPKVGE